MNPSYATIITQILPAQVDGLREFLRGNADPQLGMADSFLACRPLFQFDRISSLHFCSFVILDADDETGPSLVFEATFDGAISDFFDEVLRVAPAGFDAIYRCCEGYPPSGVTARTLVREYLIRHDVGANTFFSGNPGRTVAQIKGESGVRNEIVAFLSQQFASAAVLPARPAGLLDVLKRECICGTEANRWAEQAALTPWQVTFRTEIARASAVLVFVLACCLGYVVLFLVDRSPAVLLEALSRGLATVDDGRGAKASALPWIWELADAMPFSFLTAMLTVGIAWLVVRIAELLLNAASRDTRDQVLVLRLPLQLAVITRYVLVAAIGGIVALALMAGTDASPAWSGVFATGMDGLCATLLALGVLVLQLVIAAVIFCSAWHRAGSLRVMVEIQPLRPKREALRRLALDVLEFIMVISGGIGILLLATLLPDSVLGTSLASAARSIIYVYFLILILAWVGIVAGYIVASLVLCVIGLLERRDRSRFEQPAGLLARAAENAAKYQREEGGINRYQNHLASITHIKPGMMRRWLLRSVLFAINILARFWFNKGELGGIPTILSARWVMIDGGRRLLFLDNFGGSWESYLNEFIDLPAVKGLNAIWTNTFVHAGGKRYGFPATKFLFWAGAQDARPFKAYVRQSQVETLVWYSAYPTLGVVAINANTDARQALFTPLNTPEIDQLFQRF